MISSDQRGILGMCMCAPVCMQIPQRDKKEENAGV